MSLQKIWGKFLLLSLLLVGSGVQAEFRKWTNDAGRVIDAEWIKLEGEVVHLRMRNGKIGKVPLRTLSGTDQKWVREQSTPAPKPAIDDPKPAPSRPAPRSEPGGIPKWPNDFGEGVPVVFPEWQAETPSEPQVRRVDGKFVDHEGNEVWKDSKVTRLTGTFSEGLAVVSSGIRGKPGLLGYVDLSGKFVLGGDSEAKLPEGAIALGNFGENGWAPFGIKNPSGDLSVPILWGYLDKTGKVMIEPKWGSARPFKNGFARVSRTFAISDWGPGTWSYLDESGKEVMKGGWVRAHDFSDDGIALVRVDTDRSINPKGTRWSYLKSNGSLMVVGDFMKSAGEFRNGRAVADGKLIDTNGKVLLDPPKGMYLTECGDSSGVCHLTAFRRGDEKGNAYRLVHRQTGQCYGPVIRAKKLLRFHEGLACFQDAKTGNLGFLDRTGKVAIAARFVARDYESMHFENGLAKYLNRAANTYEYLNRKGEIVKTTKGPFKKK